MCGRSKRKGLNYVHEGILGKLQCWKQATLSQAGKEVLIKAVVQAIPAYPMNLFKFPVTLCKEIDSMIAKFWWGHDTAWKHIHWLSKDTLGLPKAKGRLGFGNFIDFNDVLLVKQYWRLFHEPDSLWAKLLKAYYFPHFSFLDAKRGGRASWAWSSLLTGRDLLLRGTHWQVMTWDDIRL